MFKNKTILVTGGTGSLGQAFILMTLKKYDLKKIIVFSRDEMKQWEMAKLYKDDNRIRFFIGDIRDKERLYRALSGVDIVLHAAATKIVPTSEYDPFECIKTNINGAMNIINTSIDCGVEKIIALSTDKASSPSSLYGASKLVSDKLFISANSYTGEHLSKFSVVRYGNVMGSRGSVIPYFESIKDSNVFPVTDERMTRFMITLEQGVELIWKTFQDMRGGEIFVKKIPSMNIIDIVRSFSDNPQINKIGIRPGEKLHEQMISKEDAPYTYEFDDYYKIFSPFHDNSPRDGKKVPNDFEYNSGSNKENMSIDDLKKWIIKNKNILGTH